MNKLSREKIAQVLLDAQPLSFAHRLGITIEDASAASLFRLLCMALLYDPEAGEGVLARVSEIFAGNRWYEPQFLYESTFEERLNALRAAEYVIFDERENRARWLGEMAERVLFGYAGDLKTLRRSAYRDPGAERKMLGGFAGMNAVNVDFFIREVQVAWCEHYPFISIVALSAALQLNIGETVEEVVALVPSLELPRFAWALEEVERSCGYEEVRRKAAELQETR